MSKQIAVATQENYLHPQEQKNAMPHRVDSLHKVTSTAVAISLNTWLYIFYV